MKKENFIKYSQLILFHNFWGMKLSVNLIEREALTSKEISNKSNRSAGSFSVLHQSDRRCF